MKIITVDRTAIIRTSDRSLFKQCRRKWKWQSHMQGNLEPNQAATPLWFGTGIHFALEDMYGTKKFESPVDAFQAYVNATQHARQSLPDDWIEMTTMGRAMLAYYTDYWLNTRDGLKTFIFEGIPQTEVNCLAEVPFDVRKHFPDSPYSDIMYSCTLDRVVVDEHDRLWIVDYKTAKSLKASHFANDPQVTAYCWIASHIYQRPIAGMIYWQFLKACPEQPEPLKSGKISIAKNKRTSHPLYRQALIDAYGDVKSSPAENITYLNQLALQESEDQDAYIRRDKIHKNPESLEAEGAKILLEMQDMLNPNLPIYPNANFMCPGLCAFYEMCVSMDDGTDWEAQIAEETQQRSPMDESWRVHLRYPGEESIFGGSDLDLTKKDFE